MLDAIGKSFCAYLWRMAGFAVCAAPKGSKAHGLHK